MSQQKEFFTLEPIAHLECSQFYRYQQPRQGVFASNEGVVRIIPGHHFEEALFGLEGFSHIWLLYVFHLNQGWRPLVKPPVNPDGTRKGVFATRSPHRPSRLGMSCVELVSIAGGALTIRNFDLLDKTPIVDIKPYIPQVDSFPHATRGWLPEKIETYNCDMSELFCSQALWILNECAYDFVEFVRVQLSHDPLNMERKRIVPRGTQSWEIAFRTWRIVYRLDETKKSVFILHVESAYSDADLQDMASDRWEDKALHNRFLEIWSCTTERVVE